MILVLQTFKYPIKYKTLSNLSERIMGMKVMTT